MRWIKSPSLFIYHNKKHNGTSDLYNFILVQQIFLNNYFAFLVFLEEVKFNTLITTSINLIKLTIQCHSVTIKTGLLFSLPNETNDKIAMQNKMKSIYAYISHSHSKMCAYSYLASHGSITMSHVSSYLVFD